MVAPKTLQQAIVYFSDYQHCHDALVAVRWPDGVVKCPRCGSDKVTYLAGTANDFFGFTELNFPSFRVDYLYEGQGECAVPEPA